ncbi:hypothetical protein [Petrachloros mirabilis]
MNCKPDDIAQIVRCPTQESTKYLGSLVKIIAFVGQSTHIPGVPDFNDMWDCIPLSPRLRNWANEHGHTVVHVPDCILRPLPGITSDDEVAKTAEKPKKVTA